MRRKKQKARDVRRGLRSRLAALEGVLAPPEPPGCVRVVRGAEWDRVYWCPAGCEPTSPRAKLLSVMQAGMWDGI